MRFSVRSIALLLLLASPAVYAQPWSGPAAVEVRVEDQKGLPVAGAQVHLQYTFIDPKDGPPPLVTDERGRASVSGLAEGSWVLEVSREGFMTYLAEIGVRENGRPVVVQATQVKVPGALRTLEVVVSKGRPAAPAPARPEPRPAPRQETPAPPAPETRPAVPVPAPSPAPSVTPPPAPAEPAPAPAPPPLPPAQPAETVRLRTARDRTCVECQPGESSLTLERVVTPGGGSCGADIAALLAGGEAPADLAAGCHVLRIALPAGARYIGYQYEVQDGGESVLCPAGLECPGVGGRWPGNPILVKAAQGTVVLAPFESGTAGSERRAVFTVYFSGGRR